VHGERKQLEHENAIALKWIEIAKIAVGWRQRWWRWRWRSRQ
jgi:hypothetical protein